MGFDSVYKNLQKKGLSMNPSPCCFWSFQIPTHAGIQPFHAIKRTTSLGTPVATHWPPLGGQSTLKRAKFE